MGKDLPGGQRPLGAGPRVDGAPEGGFKAQRGGWSAGVPWEKPDGSPPRCHGHGACPVAHTKDVPFTSETCGKSFQAQHVSQGALPAALRGEAVQMRGESTSPQGPPLNRAGIRGKQQLKNQGWGDWSIGCRKRGEALLLFASFPGLPPTTPLPHTPASSPYLNAARSGWETLGLEPQDRLSGEVEKDTS